MDALEAWRDDIGEVPARLRGTLARTDGGGYANVYFLHFGEDTRRCEPAHLDEITGSVGISVRIPSVHLHLVAEGDPTVTDTPDSLYGDIQAPQSLVPEPA